MSTDVPPQSQPAADDDEDELVLEDVIEDTETENNSSGEGLELIEVDEANEEDVQKEEEDNDIELIEVEKKLFTDGFYEMERQLKEMADKFFDPESPTNMCNLSVETRQATARYAAALFEWFCCMPSADNLDELCDLGDMPFPITPDRRRVLLRRELGVRLAEIWRQSKTTARLATHFKLNENIALLSLLDYAITNPSYDLDVVPMLKEQQMHRMDYFQTGSLLVQHSDPKLWKTPQQITCELLLPPLAASICLYILHTECIRGTPITIPWESFQIDHKDVPAELLAELEDTVLAAFDQLEEGDDKKINQQLEAEKRKLELLIEATTKETATAREQLKMGEAKLETIKVKHDELRALRKKAIASITPDNFVENGEELKKADEDIMVMEKERPDLVRIEQETLLKEDVALKEGDKILARRKDDSYETFEDAIVVAVEGDERVLVRFVREMTAGGGGVDISLPITSVACKRDKGLPLVMDGVRVACRVRHPMQKKDAIYSGTVISRLDLSTNDYLVLFDDFFDRYVQRNHVHLMAAQPFHDGIFNRRMTYKYVTPNASLPEPSKERQCFIALFSMRYPQWTLVKMKEKLGKNVSVKHRDGTPWVAQAVAVDRGIVTLRFNPIQTFDSDVGCLDYPCKKHDHLDEQMYRGNPRLVQVRNLCNFDHFNKNFEEQLLEGKAETQFSLQWTRDANTSRAAMRRQRRNMHSATGVAFEPAVPIVEATAKVERPSQVVLPGQKVKFRKQGTALQTEPALPVRQQRKKKNEGQLVHKNHVVEFARFRNAPFHGPCTHECLQGMDADASAQRFVNGSYSPFFIPMLCGWTRPIANNNVFVEKKKNGREVSGEKNIIFFYRTPCGRPLHRMSEVIDYLEMTRSELTIDLFTFSSGIDVTAYVVHDEKFVVLDDLTRGSEGRPLPVVNDMDNEPVPSFLYRSMRYPQTEAINFSTVNKDFCSGCDCTDDCRDWTKCACQRLTHRESVRARRTFNNVTKGYINRSLPDNIRSGLYECNENCGCSRKRCFNRVVQNDIKIPMQMMKTEDMGWGIRTLVDIPQGTFVSCYQGAIMSDQMAETFGEGDEYYADLDFYSLAENEKVNSGADMMYDQGVVVDDCGLRNLSLREIEEVDKRDDLTELRRKVKETNKRERKELARKKREEEEEARRNQEEMEGVGEKVGDGREEEESRDGTSEEREGGSEEREEGNGRGEEDGGGDTEDDEDEGMVEGDSADEEEEEMDEEKKKEEKEKDNERREEEKRQAIERKKKEDERKKAMKDTLPRFTIPLRNEEELLQYDMYFDQSSATNLYTVDAKACGNLGRQFNHSCDPNMFTQHVFVDTHDIRLPWVAFFTKRDVKAGEELCWDYGYKVAEDAVPNPDKRTLKCKCGAECCRIDLL